MLGVLGLSKGRAKVLIHFTKTDKEKQIIELQAAWTQH